MGRRTLWILRLGLLGPLLRPWDRALLAIVRGAKRAIQRLMTAPRKAGHVNVNPAQKMQSVW